MRTGSNGAHRPAAAAPRGGMISTATAPAPLPPRVTVIIPCLNEVRYISPCLDSICRQSYPRACMEVLVLDGGSTDGTLRAVERYAAQHAWIRLIPNPRRIAATALNIGIRSAGGDVIARMDAHCEYPPQYLERLVAALLETGADNVGACVATLPANQSARARGLAAAQAHPLGVGSSWFRIGVREPRWVDTVPFGCYRREVFRRIGLFDEALVRNQDDELNHRLIRHGGKILLVPDATVRYYSRGTYHQVARMYYQYGYYKPLAARKIGAVMTLRQLTPAAFLAAVCAGVLLSPLWSAAGAATLALAGGYAAAVVGVALQAAPTRGAGAALAMAAALPVLHFSYGWGYLRGLWNLLVARRPFAATAALSR
ncbi:MAG TPA: glycosyltransferase family 2 protein [Gemmatimonadales bacterium]|nr:glycosyltransferase family 2 protein [Gemmatimonadales bacterium]